MLCAHLAAVPFWRLIRGIPGWQASGYVVGPERVWALTEESSRIPIRRTQTQLIQPSAGFLSCAFLSLLPPIPFSLSLLLFLCLSLSSAFPLILKMFKDQHLGHHQLQRLSEASNETVWAKNFAICKGITLGAYFGQPTWICSAATLGMLSGIGSTEQDLRASSGLLRALLELSMTFVSMNSDVG